MIPLGCSGSCQERDTLFLDVLSFLMTVMGDGAAEGAGGRGEGEKQTEFISVPALGKERGFHYIHSQPRSGPAPTAAAGLQPWYSCLGAPWPHGKRAEIFSSTGGGLVARQQMVLICYYSVSNEIYSAGENTEQNSSSTCLSEC